MLLALVCRCGAAGHRFRPDDRDRRRRERHHRRGDAWRHRRSGSPALIENARSVITDAQGRYKIVDLRPGTYTVTFTLPGFSTVKREGIELRAQFTATVNADLRVGALEETVTVSRRQPGRGHAERHQAPGGG